MTPVTLTIFAHVCFRRPWSLSCLTNKVRFYLTICYYRHSWCSACHSNSTFYNTSELSKIIFNDWVFSPVMKRWSRCVCLLRWLIGEMQMSTWQVHSLYTRQMASKLHDCQLVQLSGKWLTPLCTSSLDRHIMRGCKQLKWTHVT